MLEPCRTSAGELSTKRWAWNGVDLEFLSNRRIDCVLTYMLNRSEFTWDQVDIVLKEIERRDKMILRRMRMSSEKKAR